MFYTILISVAISLLIISTLHYLFLFFKETLTVPIVKDLIVQPTQTYKYLETISNSNSNSNSNSTTRVNSLTASNSNGDPFDSNSMKIELTHYLNDLNDLKYSSNTLDNLSNTSTLDILTKASSLDNVTNTKLYSEIR
jgi:hypothetical protein